MLKINLLAEKRAKKEVAVASPARTFLTKILIIALATFLAMLGITYYMSSEKESLKKQYEQNKALIAQLQKNIQDVKKFESLNASIGQKATLIESLRKNQAVPVRILDEVSSYLPQGVWLSSLLYKDNVVSIEGFAFTNLDVVAYVENLKKSQIIKDISLDESKSEEIDKMPIYKFKLNFKVRV